MSRAPKSDRERGPIGAWARAERLRWGLRNAEEGVERIRALTGYRMRADYLRGIEAGTNRPGPETLKALETTYQSKAPRDQRENVDELVERLIVALNGHAESNWALVKELAPLASLGAAAVGAEGAVVLAELAGGQQGAAARSGSRERCRR
jgi:hypothetical protein